MLRHYLSTILFTLTLLLFTPVYGDVALHADTSLDHFSYDLDSMHIALEKIQINWQLSTSNNQTLSISRLKAKRLTVTMNKNKDSRSALPDHINLPMPINIAQAEISEVIIQSENDVQRLSNVTFSFEGNNKTLNLTSLKANTPWGEANASLHLSTAKPFAVNGHASLKQTNNEYVPYDINANLSGDLSMLHVDTAGLLVLQDNQLAIQQSIENTQTPVAHIQTNGTIQFSDNNAIVLNAKITDMHPERMGAYPAAILNLEVNATGNLDTSPKALIQFKLNDSQWQNQPLSGSAGFVLEQMQIQQLTMQAALNHNKLEATGSIGKPDSKLTWLADLANINELDHALKGELHAQGSIGGTFDNLALDLKVWAQHLTLPNDLSIERLDGSAVIEAGIEGKVDASFKTSNMQYGQQQLASSLTSIKGTRKNHQVTITAQDKNLAFNSTLQGELSNNLTWHGMIQGLTYSGETELTLAAPAALSWDKNGLSITQAAFSLAKGNAYLDNLKINNTTFVSKGHIDQLSLTSLPQHLLPSGVTGDAIFSGKWDINIANAVNGNISIWRNAGDITVNANANTSKPLGLTEAKLEMLVSDNRINIASNINGKHFGQLTTALNTSLSKTASGFALLSNAPLTLNTNAQLHTLTWLTLFPSLADMNLDGQLSLSAQANGTLASPNLTGNVSGKNIALNIISQGVALTNGTIEASFQNDALNINQASWQGGNGGLKTSGIIYLNQGKPSIDLTWTADKFTALSRTDRLLILSGAGKTTLNDSILSIFGDFTVNKGLVELAQEDTPELDEDVTVIGDSTLIKESALQILLNGLHINIGDDFVLRGRGLDTQLTGGLTLTGLTQYNPHTEGSIQVKKGTYLAYGQTLNITRGILNFNGPMDNPGINIRAMRNSKPVNAGIEITGSAAQPLTKLVSEPEVAESEKLSWLVLGHGMAEAGKNDYGMLSLAAGVLLSQGQSIPLQTQLARAAGLDEFSFTGGGAESAALVFGKRLNSQLYLSYEKSISGLLDIARLTFNITSRWSLTAEAGSESAVDVLYTFSFK